MTEIVNRYKDFIIYNKMLTVIAWLFVKVNTFPKKQRFVLGQQIQNSAVECLKLIVKTNESKNDKDKLSYLSELNTELEILRSLLRVSYEVGFLKGTSLGYGINMIDEIGRMCGGWMKKIGKQES